MIFLDCETTGLVAPGQPNPAHQPRIIEIAAVSVDWEKETSMCFSALINPGVSVPADASKINGITDEMLKGERPFASVVLELIKVFRQDPDNMLVGHNLAFDLDMLVYELKRIGWEHRFPYCQHQLDTVPMSGNLKLEKWASKLGVLKEPQQHRALADVQLLIECYKRSFNEEEVVGNVAT